MSHETRVKTHWEEAVPEIKSPMFRISRSPAGSEFPATGNTAKVGPKDYKGQRIGKFDQKNSRFLANGTMKTNFLKNKKLKSSEDLSCDSESLRVHYHG